MTIYLYYKEFLLGELTTVKENYIYNSNTIGEILFNRRTFIAPFYNLFNSSDKKLDKLPEVFAPFIRMSNDTYIKKEANIEVTDNEFTKLYKIGQLPLDQTGFYIKSVS